LPAIGQGALGLECRAEDLDSRQLLTSLNDLPTYQAVLAERALLRTLGGGCLVPVGAVTTIDGDTLVLRGVVLSPDGVRRLEGIMRGRVENAEEIGELLAADLLAKGAGDILQGISR
jgi:hydroxymethylbilane synthase